MNKFSHLINIITIILANNSWSYSDNSAVSFANSWSKNNQVNISDFGAIRSLGENENEGETQGVGKYDANDDEGYDKGRYDALTQDYFDMMEDDLNRNKESTLTISEMINNIDPRAQFNYYISRASTDAFSRRSAEYAKRLWRKIKKGLRTIDKITEREMYNILKSKYFAGSNVLLGRTMTQKVRKFLYRYKIFSPVLILVLTSYLCTSYFSATGYAIFFALAAIFTSFYLAFKYVKCSIRLRRLSEHIPKHYRNEFRRLKRDIENEEHDTFYSTQSVDESTESINIS
ncbi:Pv-fam-d protein [Plasmodium coatneyi]|uniref:Pv-fam-d protein n=1 Tax=Plasmodium coatneyi TaxID=208452 RepID=A0A1B1E3C0_9APIC|nr:Pv-fam-d protein [Plasmodium coatneyi]ANQ09502.1 Pv-fam-d protein [Plasmodium coatneyi]